MASHRGLGEATWDALSVLAQLKLLASSYGRPLFWVTTSLSFRFGSLPVNPISLQASIGQARMAADTTELAIAPLRTINVSAEREKNLYNFYM